MKSFLLFIFLILSILRCHAQVITLNEMMSSNHSIISDFNGVYSDWIEIHNSSSLTVNLHNYGLSDDSSNYQKWKFPAISISPNGFLIVFCSGKDTIYSNELHSNFKIKSSGENLFLSNNSNQLIDSLAPVILKENKSFGRLNDGSTNLGFLSLATPNSLNNGENFISQIYFSKEAGFYSNSFNLQMTCSDSLFYTLDGSLPSLYSELYLNPILIDATQNNGISTINSSHFLYETDIYPNDYSEFPDNGGFKVKANKSTFFPDNWGIDKLQAEIAVAIKNKGIPIVYPDGRKLYKGTMTDGTALAIWENVAGNIISTYPIL